MFDSVGELLGAAGSGPAGLADGDLTDAVEAAEAWRRRIDAAETALLAELDVRGVCDRDHGLSTTGWLARQAELPRSVARTRVKVAATLRSTLPAVAEALAAGRIGWDHARVFATVTNARNADAMDAVASELIDLAQGMVFDHWAHRVGYTARLLDPDGPTPPGLDANTARVSRTLDGAVKVDATLVGTIGEVFAQAVEHRADVLYRRYRSDHHTNPDIAIPSRATLRALAMADLAGFPLHAHDDDDGLDDDAETDSDSDDGEAGSGDDDTADHVSRGGGDAPDDDAHGDACHPDSEGTGGSVETSHAGVGAATSNASPGLVLPGPARRPAPSGLVLPDGCRRPATRVRPGLVLPPPGGTRPRPAPATARPPQLVLPDGRPAIPPAVPPARRPIPSPNVDLGDGDGDPSDLGDPRAGPDPTNSSERPDRPDRQRRRRRRPRRPPPTRPEILLVAHAGQPGALSTPDGLALDDEWARAINCDADWHPVVVDSLGVPLTAGRTIRHATLAQRRAIRLRDGGCVYPGCDAPFHWCDLHHITHWTAHGPTDTDNLAALCRRHHGVTHRTGWTMHTTPDQWFTWTTPTGHTISSQRHHRRRPEGASPGAD